MTCHVTLQMVFPTRAVLTAAFLTGKQQRRCCHIVSVDSPWMSAKILGNRETLSAAPDTIGELEVDICVTPRISRLV